MKQIKIKHLEIHKVIGQMEGWRKGTSDYLRLIESGELDFLAYNDLLRIDSGMYHPINVERPSGVYDLILSNGDIGKRPSKIINKMRESFCLNSLGLVWQASL